MNERTKATLRIKMTDLIELRDYLKMVTSQTGIVTPDTATFEERLYTKAIITIGEYIRPRHDEDYVEFSFEAQFEEWDALSDLLHELDFNETARHLVAQLQELY